MCVLGCELCLAYPTHSADGLHYRSVIALKSLLQNSKQRVTTRESPVACWDVPHLGVIEPWRRNWGDQQIAAPSVLLY